MSHPITAPDLNKPLTGRLADPKARVKRKALIVGIDRYKHFPESNLNGCGNDAANVFNSIVNIGKMPHTQAKVLTNERATLDRILKGLDWLVKGAEEGDILFYYHSSHGSYVVDDSGDEIDHYDEVLCTHDMDFANGVYLSDDVLAQKLDPVPAGVRLTCMFDTCHSGTVTRLLAPVPVSLSGVVRARASIIRQRFLPPPVDFAVHRPFTSRGTRLVKTEAGINRTVWSAAHADQTALEVEINGKPQGLFTATWFSIYRAANGNIGNQRLYQTLLQDLERQGYAREHTPQLEVLEQDVSVIPFRRQKDIDREEELG